MKIGFQGRFLDLPFTGIGQYSRGLLEEFEKEFRNKNIDRNVTVRNQASGEIVVCRPKRSLMGRVLWRHFFEQHEVPKFFRRHPVDLIHFPYPGNPWRSLNVPTIVTVHDVIPWIFPEYRSSIFSSLASTFSKRAIHLATRVVTVSNFSKREIIRVCGVPEEKISVIYNGCREVYSPATAGNSATDFFYSAAAAGATAAAAKFSHSAAAVMPTETIFTTAKFSKLFSDQLKPFSYMLYVGGYDRRKNVDRLLDAFRLFSAHQKNAVLVLVGRPLFKTSLYQKTGLADLTFERCGDTIEVADVGNGARVVRTNFLGTDFLNEEFLAILYRHCRFFVHLSSYEGFNIPLLEAAKCGAPLLLSDIEVHREIARNAAVFVDQSDLVSVVNGMKTFWNSIRNDEEIRKDFVRRSLDMAQQYSLRKSAHEHLSLYGALCRSLPSSSPSWSSPR